MSRKGHPVSINKDRWSPIWCKSVHCSHLTMLQKWPLIFQHAAVEYDALIMWS